MHKTVATPIVTIFAACSLAACGGGGDVAGSGLAFQAIWEQAAGTGTLTYGEGPGDYNFGSAIPAAVNTVRITLEPTTPVGPPSCCIAVSRGSQAFTDRSLVLAEILPGDTNVKIYGYPTDYAPADGLLRRCATVPSNAGEACDATRSALPSFGSDGNVVSVVGGERADAGVIAVWSLPFLVDIDPAPGSTVVGPTLSFSTGVVDAINNVMPGDLSVSVASRAIGADVPFAVNNMAACDEQVAVPAVPCSSTGSLDVTGYVVGGSGGPVAPGVVQVTISGSNDGTPPRSVAYTYEVNVAALPTTTSTTNSTVSSSTVTSTSVTSSTFTTTTTLGVSQCQLTFGLTNPATLAALTFDVDYGAATGEFTGTGASVSCTANAATGALAAFNDNDAARTMRVGLLAVADFAGPLGLATCEFTGVPAPVAGDFGLTIVEAFAADLSVVPATVAITDLSCN